MTTSQLLLQKPTFNYKTANDWLDYEEQVRAQELDHPIQLSGLRCLFHLQKFSPLLLWACSIFGTHSLNGPMCGPDPF